MRRQINFRYSVSSTLTLFELSLSTLFINKIKINNSKTEFDVVRSPQLMCDLGGLSVNVGESPFTQSSKFRV